MEKSKTIIIKITTKHPQCVIYNSIAASSSRSNKDSDLQPIKGGSVMDMDEEQSQLVCQTMDTFKVLNISIFGGDIYLTS